MVGGGGWAGSGKGRPGPWGEKERFEGKVVYKGVAGVCTGGVSCVYSCAPIYTFLKYAPVTRISGIDGNGEKSEKD